MDIILKNGKAHELFSDGAPELHKDIEVVRDYTGDVSVGDDWDGTTFTAPVDTRTYVEKRLAEYPPITDYLDAIVKGDSVQEQAYIDACLAVKAKYPKS
jgi:hypothetical protein